MFNSQSNESLTHNPLTHSLFSVDYADGSPTPPPDTNAILLLDAGNFLLLNGTNFDLL